MLLFKSLPIFLNIICVKKIKILLKVSKLSHLCHHRTLKSHSNSRKPELFNRLRLQKKVRLHLHNTALTDSEDRMNSCERLDLSLPNPMWEQVRSNIFPLFTRKVVQRGLEEMA